MRRLRGFYLRGGYLALLLPILFSLSFPRLAAAQTSATAPTNGFSAEISPLPILLNVKPGSTGSADLRIRNSGSVDETFKVVLKTYHQAGADGHIVFTDPGPSDTFLKWVSFSKTVFDAPPGLWQTIKMNVNVPKTADYGYYYAVQFEIANPPTPKPGTTGLQGAVAIFVLLNAEGPGQLKQAEVTDFKAGRQSYEFLPADFTIQIHNSGNIHLSAYGNVFIMRGKKQIASLPINSTQSLVLPHSNKQFKVSWGDGFPSYKVVNDADGNPVLDKDGRPTRKLNWNFSQLSKLRFGHYTANLTLIYNNGQRDVPITGSLSFWVIPWRILGIVLVVLLLVGLGLWSSLRRTGKFINRQTKRVKKPRHETKTKS